MIAGAAVVVLAAALLFVRPPPRRCRVVVVAAVTMIAIFEGACCSTKRQLQRSSPYDFVEGFRPTTPTTTKMLRNHRQHQRRLYVVKVPEHVWREEAALHRRRIRDLLLPGLTPADHELNSSSARQGRRGRSRAMEPQKLSYCGDDDKWTALDPKNPVYNFLIEYYGLKGRKGPRRLARWSPDPTTLLLLHQQQEEDEKDSSSRSSIASSILLQGADQEDIGGTLHMRGAIMHEEGILYCPSTSFGGKNNIDQLSPHSTKGREGQEVAVKARSATPFLWYRSILRSTIKASPVLHCHGLHEWAMIYHPPGADAPPSAGYQGHLPLRVSRETICETVSRNGVNCTHVDALRFFAPAAGPLNHYGATLERVDQLRLEQPACVHASMDLLKMALKLQPFCSADLIRDCLEIAIEARRLDVAASPYDASAYGVPVVPVETAAGRAQYRKEQVALMDKAQPIRARLLDTYEVFLKAAFLDHELEEANRSPGAERFAKASPGSPPWRRNLIEQ